MVLDSLTPGMLIMGGGALVAAAGCFGVLIAKLQPRFKFSLVGEQLTSNRSATARWIQDTERKLQSATRRSKVRRFLIAYILFGASAFAATWYVFANLPAAILLGLTFLKLPTFVMDTFEDRRVNRIEESLAVAIHIFDTEFSRSHKVEKAFSAVANRADGPVARVFASAHFDMLMNKPWEGILSKLSIALKSPYGYSFVQIISQLPINAKAAEQFSTLVDSLEDHLKTVRDYRSKIYGEEISLLILCIAPIPVYLVTRIIEPSVQVFVTSYLLGKICIVISFGSILMYMVIRSWTRKVN